MTEFNEARIIDLLEQLLKETKAQNDLLQQVCDNLTLIYTK